MVNDGDWHGAGNGAIQEDALRDDTPRNDTSSAASDTASDTPSEACNRQARRVNSWQWRPAAAPVDAAVWPTAAGPVGE
jgi:hypothetical protein